MRLGHDSISPPERPPMSTKPVRWGLIGASNIAADRRHSAPSARQAARSSSVMSSDAAARRRLRRRPRHPQCHGLSRRAARRRIDAVYISTTNELHRAQTLAAAKAGKHVLCEKPLDLSLAGCPRDGRRLPRRGRGDGHQPPSAQRRHAPRHARGDRGGAHRQAAVRAASSMPSICRRTCRAGASRRRQPARAS